MSRTESAGGTRLLELAAVFLKLGSTAFGGPAAHVGLMEQEFVRRRGWLSQEEFLDLLGATNLIPGPNSTEMAMYIGRKRAGWAGLVLAGACFILPAMLLVGALAWAYLRFGKLPQIEGLLYGVKPVIIAVVVQALWRLTRSAVKSKALAAFGLAAVALNVLGVNELLVLFGAGNLVMLGRVVTRRRKQMLGVIAPLLGSASLAPVISAASVPAAAAAPTSLSAIFLFFLKVGSVLIGSGYVLLAFLRADLVERWHWVTESQLLDAIAVGQVTPGPIFTTATFVGYLLGGPVASMVATVGIFLPAFVFTAISGPLIPRLRRSAAAGAFLDGINIASLALMGVVTWQLGAAALVDWPALLLAIAAAVLLLRYGFNSAWLVLGGGVAGFLISMMRAS